jgi:hypothetical protein
MIIKENKNKMNMMLKKLKLNQDIINLEVIKFK